RLLDADLGAHDQLLPLGELLLDHDQLVPRALDPAQQVRELHRPLPQLARQRQQLGRLRLSLCRLGRAGLGYHERPPSPSFRTPTNGITHLTPPSLHHSLAKSQGRTALESTALAELSSPERVTLASL